MYKEIRCDVCMFSMLVQTGFLFYFLVVFLLIVFVFAILYCHACFHQPYGHMYENAVLMALLYVMFLCAFVTFPCGRCPGSDMVLDCTDSSSLPFFFTLVFVKQQLLHLCVC